MSGLYLIETGNNPSTRTVPGRTKSSLVLLNHSQLSKRFEFDRNYH